MDGFSDQKEGAGNHDKRFGLSFRHRARFAVGVGQLRHSFNVCLRVHTSTDLCQLFWIGSALTLDAYNKEVVDQWGELSGHDSIAFVGENSQYQNHPRVREMSAERPFERDHTGDVMGPVENHARLGGFD